MNEQEFERLWQAAEAENYAQQLRDEYPRWQARRRRNMGVAASLIVAVGIALPLLHRPQTEAPPSTKATSPPTATAPIWPTSTGWTWLATC